MNRRGQSVLSEHVMVFFVVIAAIVAITVFVQRSLEARINEAHNFMISSVNDPSVCDSDCQAATGGVTNEYEPYYQQAFSSVDQNSQDFHTTGAGSANVIGAIYNKESNEQTQSNSFSIQLPAACGGPNPASGCNQL